MLQVIPPVQEQQNHPDDSRDRHCLSERGRQGQEWGRPGGRPGVRSVLLFVPMLLIVAVLT